MITDDPLGHDYPDEGRERIALVDFDGTLAVYEGWEGDYHTGPPLRTTLGLLKLLKEHDYTVVIFTTRLADVVKTWLAFYDLTQYVDEVTSVKIPAELIIDDRAITFDPGDLDSLINTIKGGWRPWWEKSRPKTTNVRSLPSKPGPEAIYAVRGEQAYFRSYAREQAAEPVSNIELASDLRVTRAVLPDVPPRDEE